jgi:hypothetical protein
MNAHRTFFALAIFSIFISPCFSAEKLFLEGAKHKAITDGGGETDKRWMMGFFTGYINGVLDSKAIPEPKTLNRGQICSMTATFIQQNPQQHHKSEIDLVRAAIQKMEPAPQPQPSSIR